MTADKSSNLERWLKISGVALTLGGLLVGIYQSTTNQAVEAARPFLERKLQWCEEAVEVAADIAVFGRESTLSADPTHSAVRRVDRFWALYYGVMGMVESKDVEPAMVAFGDGLRTAAVGDEAGKRAEGLRALAIAHACRSEMSGWSPAWGR